MKKLLIISFCLYLTSCQISTYTFLHDSSLPLNLNSQARSNNYVSGISKKENSIVEVEAWLVNTGSKQHIRYDFKITNNDNQAYVTPANIIILDADKQLIRLLSPEEFVYYKEGMTSEEALIESNAMAKYAEQMQANQPTYGMMQYKSSLYGQFYNNSLTGYQSGYGTYKTYKQPSVAGGFASGYALGRAMKAKRINRSIRESNLISLRQQLTVPSATNKGRTWSLSATQPIQIIVITSGDKHTITLDVVNTFLRPNK